VNSSFYKYSFLAWVVQLLACASIWIAALIFSHVVNPLFETMVFFYWPTIILVGMVLGTSGESAMIAVPIYGMGIGMILYAMIFGLFISYFKTKA
jgi:hypothetical protein